MTWTNRLPGPMRSPKQTHTHVAWPAGTTDYDVPTFIRRGIHIPKLEALHEKLEVEPLLPRSVAER